MERELGGGAVSCALRSMFSDLTAAVTYSSYLTSSTFISICLRFIPDCRLVLIGRTLM